MTTIETITSSLAGAPKRPTRARCTICGARFPRRKSADRCGNCGGTRLADPELHILKAMRNSENFAQKLEPMLLRIRQHQVEALAWVDGQLQFLSAVTALNLPDLSLETLIARGYVPEGKILEMFRAAHARDRLGDDTAEASTVQ